MKRLKFLKKISKLKKLSLLKKLFELRYLSVFVGGVFLLVVVFVGTKLFTFSNTITVESEVEYEYPDFEIEEEDRRIDVLFLGIRGAADPNGGLLADTLILASFDEGTEKMSLVSIPRDLYVEMPDINQEDCDEGRTLNTNLLSDYGSAKINEAYALGLSCGGEAGGLSLAKHSIRYVTGVYVDHVVVINFTGFKQLIDIFDGVQITRSKPFSEKQQWQGEGKSDSDYWIYHDPEPTEDADEGEGYWEFYIPAGTHILDGETSLYYIRSRFSSSDFDRSIRQQQIINALKNKALSLKVISDINKPFEIIDSVGRNVRTDMQEEDIFRLLNLSKKYQEIIPEQDVLLIGDEDNPRMLTESYNKAGSYIIVPTKGDWEETREYFRNILKNEEPDTA